VDRAHDRIRCPQCGFVGTSVSGFCFRCLSPLPLRRIPLWAIPLAAAALLLAVVVAGELARMAGPRVLPVAVQPTATPAPSAQVSPAATSPSVATSSPAVTTSPAATASLTSGPAPAAGATATPSPFPTAVLGASQAPEPSLMPSTATRGEVFGATPTPACSP
jgi:hypothetical protein